MSYRRVKEGIKARIQIFVAATEPHPVSAPQQTEPGAADQPEETGLEAPHEVMVYEDIVLLSKANARRKFVQALREQAGPSVAHESDATLELRVLELEQQGEQALQHAQNVDMPERIGDYFIAEGRFYQAKLVADGVTYVALCNYTALIREQRIADDGAERQIILELEGTLADGAPLPVIRFPKAELDSMAGVLKGWDAKVWHSPGLTVRDKVRYCIQIFSLKHGFPTRMVYTHLGWRRIGERWTYLHAGGAVGADDIDAEPDAALAAYRLPADAEDLKTAVKASLSLLGVAARRITLPLAATMYLAPLAEWLRPDFVHHLEGDSGAMKSTLAALFMSHYGSFERQHPPGHWMRDTANALEKLAFLAKDTVLWIDDYAPTPSQMAAREQEAKFRTVVRAQGDLKGRRRMRADTSLRPDYYPRGVILSTGELTPGGTSDLARVVVVRVKSSDVNRQELTVAQEELVPHLAQAMVGYLEWLQAHLETLPAEVRAIWRQMRQVFLQRQLTHLRQPEIAAYWTTALSVFLSFAQEVGAITPAEAERLLGEATEVFADVISEHGHTMADSDPIQKFLRLLEELLIQKRVYLKAKDGTIPADAECWGWIVTQGDGGEYQTTRTTDGAMTLGWVDDTWLYLLPEVTYKTIFSQVQQAGGTLISQRALYKLLAEKQLTMIKRPRLTYQEWVEGGNKFVLKLKRAALTHQDVSQEASGDSTA